tara:strand:- start:698 stop:979 length:282 start_codon:yes stop_codon:yes gene_type:complete
MDETQTKMYIVALDELNKPLTTRVESLTKREKDKINMLSVKWIDKDEELTKLFNTIVNDELFHKVDIFEKLPIYKNQITHEEPKKVERELIKD